MDSVPAGRVEVEILVVAELTTPSQTQPSVPVPMVLLPFLKVTVPVGVLVPEVVTVAVKVTESPMLEGFSLDCRLVVVVARPVPAQAVKRLPTLTEPRPFTRL